eukprot:5359140-Amphidinium_carterae.1
MVQTSNKTPQQQANGALPMQMPVSDRPPKSQKGKFDLMEGLKKLLLAFLSGAFAATVTSEMTADI